MPSGSDGTGGRRRVPVLRQVLDRRRRAAQRAVGILAQPHGAETGRQCVPDQQLAGQAFADAEDLLQRLGRLSVPITPVTAPSTPASLQVGTVPSGGGSGYRQR